MEKITVKVATDANMDLKMIVFMKPPMVRLLLNHNFGVPPLGIGRLFKEKHALMCEIIWAPGIKEDLLLDCWPSIGGTFTTSKTSDYITAGLVQVVGICTSPNVDINIRTLREQLGIPKPSMIIEP